MDELKKVSQVDNSKLEKLIKKEITPEMQREFFEILKDSQLLLPVIFSPNMFEGIENAEVGDVFKTTGKEGFDINFISDDKANKAVPLFTSDEMMEAAGLKSSVMVMYVSDLIDLVKQSDKYSIIAINPFTDYNINMPIEAFLSLTQKPTEQEKMFFESLNKILELLKEHSYELEEDMVFFVRGDENLMKDNAIDGVVIPKIPLDISSNSDYCKNLKYTNILLFEKGKKVLPIAGVPKDETDTIVAPGTEFIFEKDLDEFTTVWKCGAQPFYD